ncbi:hypothetical protein, partial [Endozoicomonas sp. YOMI1]|uniref:hypothetical protein n=1 Tax=Endozoicomonas sp. YOMI1 TaxID=2828739 RepID=UPI00214921E3
NGQQVTPEVVIKDYQATKTTVELARFKEECCLRGLSLNGQQVTTDEVLRAFPDSPEGKLGSAYFKERCCLRGLAVDGQQVTPEAVVKDYQATKTTVELARFKEECCLRGFALNGQQVTPDEVVKDFPASPKGRLGLARFKAECCPRGLALHGQQVTPDTVVKDFPASAEGKLGIARFKEQCCLRGLPLNGQQVTPEAVVKDYQAVKATQELARFKAACCLRGLGLNGQQVPPEAVVRDCERGGWLLDSAIFYTRLALNARELNGNYLDNQTVLAAFNKVPGDHSSRQTRYLIQRLKQSQPYDEASEAQDILQEAWQILNNVSVKDDEQYRLQCILKFMANQHELTIDHQRVSAEQVLESIKTLRCSFQNSRIHFFFLARCYITKQPINGRQIHKDQVLKCLQSFPERSKLRHALGHWFAQCSSEANIIDGLLFERDNAVAPESDSLHGYATVAGQHDSSVVFSSACSQEQRTGNSGSCCLPSDGSRHSAKRVTNADGAQTQKQWSKTGEPGFPYNQVPQLNALTLKTLEIIQEINGSY